MAAPKGNTYWKQITNWKHGAEKIYTPIQLWDVAVKYFEHIEANPLKEQKVFGSGLVLNVNKMRAMTITGFCLFAQISRVTFDSYGKDEAYLYITTRIRDIIYTQKFEGACADMLNANIIARELGLSEKSENKHEVLINDLIPDGVDDGELINYRASHE